MQFPIFNRFIANNPFLKNRIAYLQRLQGRWFKPDSVNFPDVGTPFYKLVTPSNLQASESGGDLTLTWTNNSIAESGWEIWEKVNAQAYALLVTINGPASTYTYSVDANTYKHKVRPFWRNAYAEFSNETTTVVS